MQPEGSARQNKIEITEDLTIPKLFYQQTTKYGKDRVAMREKNSVSGGRLPGRIIWIM